MQDDAAQELDVEGRLADDARRGLADVGEGFRKQVVQLFAVFITIPQLLRLGAQLVVGLSLIFVAERLDLFDDGLNAADLLISACTVP